MSKKRAGASDEARALAEMARGPLDGDALEKIRRALGSAQHVVVARAAKIIREGALNGFESDLLEAFERFRMLSAKEDPGCLAKLALIEALDFGNCRDAQPFLIAAQIVQPEPVWGGRSDSAGPVRARALLALANLGFEDLVLLAADKMGDGDPAVRQAAADALAHCGARAGAAVLLMAAQRERDAPPVLLACFAGLLALAPDWGLPHLRKTLEGHDGAQRELAAIALGESRRDDALDLLVEFAEQTPLARERAQTFRAIAMHRSERALEYLLKVILEGRAGDAVAAVKALGDQREDARIAARVRQAAEKRSEATVSAAFEETFEA
ncbi:MAG: hypothetical protein FJX76_08995 [Armatimonadetes bacterium]|nr:hypothetical protein [Armatimonadota bacterium]